MNKAEIEFELGVAENGRRKARELMESPWQDSIGHAALVEVLLSISQELSIMNRMQLNG